LILTREASISTHRRASPAHLFSEVIATAGLLIVIFSLARTKRAHIAPAAVGAYIGAAYFFTSSASFANPAISVGRMFSNTFAGIASASVPGYIVAARRLRLRDPCREGLLPGPDAGRGRRGGHAASRKATERRWLDQPASVSHYESPVGRGSDQSVADPPLVDDPAFTCRAELAA
jgi:hypothetical protein